MSRFRNTFLGYRIYRKKFIGTIAVVILLCLTVFSIVFFFSVHAWMDDIRQQAQSRFQERERRLGTIESWTESYVNGMYEDKPLMYDLKALLAAHDNREYLLERRYLSQAQAGQISYVPANLKQLFLDGRSRITGVTLQSGSGLKAIWLENGDICLSFDYGEIEDLKRLNPGFGDIRAASCQIRDPGDMSGELGTLEFWIDSRELYDESSSVNAVWGVFGTDGERMTGSDTTSVQERRLLHAAQQGAQSGWFRSEDGQNVFFVKFTSREGGFSYVAVKSVAELVADNRYVLFALVSALSILAGGVILYSYAGIRTDADFLATIKGMLSEMENGRFEELQKRELPRRHRETEYGMIAVALQDVGQKLQGYIETEYILKLKEQETQMRALQHQINPHFLYNTLETLRSKALLQGDRDMADAIAMLGSLYRARMHRKDRITLGEEFQLLEMYLKIMALRFRDNFVYQMELDPEIAGMETVSFWLQPLAENFFTHGFDRNSFYNLLIVTGNAREDGAFIEVIDNGSGVPEEQLEEIRRNMYEGTDDPEADIGLRNVYMRLNYFYRDRFTMEIRNNEEGGFRISIFIGGKVGEDVHIGDR